MRLTILQKYIGAFLGLTLVVLIATLGLARWSFESGFLDYVNKLEQQRLEQVSSVLADEYVRAGDNWDSLTPRRMRRLLSRARAERSDIEPGPPPPRGGEGMRPPPRGERPPPVGGLPHLPHGLYDANGELLLGADIPESDTDMHRVPIVVEGIIVGELRSATRLHLVSQQETAFSTQQLQASWIIGAVALLLALVISVLFSRGMLSPIRKMKGDVDQLSSGDYSVRMASGRTDELGDLMNNLDRLAITLDESRESRQRWFADVSHELRTPVTVLSGELEALQDGIREFNQEQVESLQQEVQRLRYLIDDLYELSVSDIGGLKYEYSLVSLDATLAAVIEGVRVRAKDCGIEVDYAGEAVNIDGDANRLDQLLQNLLSNSLSYTDAPGKIVVKLSQSAGHAVIVIEDSPPGVSAAECEQLFEPLYRREASRSRRTGGAGLGLAICRKVVEAHGGTIEAAPSSLGGLCVRIELPVKRNDES